MSAAAIVRQLLRTFETGDREGALALLAPDAGIRIWRSDAEISARERSRALTLLFEERDRWPWLQLEIISSGGDDQRAGVEFVIQVRENGIIVDHNRAAFAEVRDGLLETLNFYCAGPVPATRRRWIAPSNLSRRDLDELFASLAYNYGSRLYFPLNRSSYYSFDHCTWGSGDAHPGSNNVSNVHWSPEEADRRIEEMIGWHRVRDIGFQWRVGGWDEPADLAERLEHHGLLLAGDQALMARTNLDDLGDIPANADLRIERLGAASDEDALEASLQVNAVAFQWPKEQVDTERPNWFEELRTAKDATTYLAWLGDTPVGTGTLVLRGPVAYLAGAATLPEFRGRHVYSSLLRRRLEQAREAGWQIAAIHAEPMSRRVVSKYGFEAVGWYQLYAWMPRMDPAVIATLVQTD